MFAWFAFFHDRNDHPAPVDVAMVQRLAAILRATPGLRRGLMMTAPARLPAHPFPNDEAPPQLVLQLYADELPVLEAALGPQGHLQALASPDTLGALTRAEIGQQVMLTRPFPVPDATFRTPPGELACSYLVHYPGAAEDLNAWHAHYLDHHPQLMAHFPGIREIEIYTRVDWVGSLPWRRLDHMQRNKLVFDSPAALSAGLLSTAITAMRSDFHRFPPFTGGNVHYPLLTRTVEPSPTS